MRCGLIKLNWQLSCHPVVSCAFDNKQCGETILMDSNFVEDFFTFLKECYVVHVTDLVMRLTKFIQQAYVVGETIMFVTNTGLLCSNLE